MAPGRSYGVIAYTSNIILFIVMIVLFLLFEIILTPFNRGFHCDDNSIRKPYVKNQTVSTTVASAVSVLLVISVIVISDVCSYLTSRGSGDVSKDDDLVSLCGIKVRQWKCRVVNRLSLMCTGFFMCMILTGIAKVMVGRLRPHFLAVCKPDYSLFNCSSGFITFKACTGTDKEALKEARKSFPSGHSSASMFAVVFFALYVEYTMIPRRFVLAKPFIQFAVVCLGIACGLTRISDYFHHWSDVLAGLFVGFIFAVYTVYGLMKLPAEEKEIRALRFRSNKAVNDLESQQIRGVPLSSSSDTKNYNSMTTASANTDVVKEDKCL